MKFLKKCALIAAIFFTYSFNWNKCKDFRKRHENFIAPTASLSSTTSFFSSIGECAMIGELEHDKKVYYVHNFDKMKIDFAKGVGEFADSFAEMHGCDHNGQRYFMKMMKSNLSELLDVESKNSLEWTYLYLESQFRRNSFLLSHCKVKV